MHSNPTLLAQHGLAIGSLSQASKSARRFAAVISISDPAAFNPVRVADGASHLRLQFEDIDHGSDIFLTADADQVAEGLSFARSASGDLLVHCHHGISRSTALAFGILVQRIGSAAAAFGTLLSMRPNAVPNRHVVCLADKILDQRGAMLATLDRWRAETPRADQTYKDRANMLQKQPDLYARRFRSRTAAA